MKNSCGMPKFKIIFLISYFKFNPVWVILVIDLLLVGKCVCNLIFVRI